MPTRRQWMIGATGGVGWLALGAPRAGEAAPAPRADRHLLYCWFEGGWDTLLSLDPADGGGRVELGLERPSDAGRSVTVGDHTFGAHVGGLARWLPRLAVVRGLALGTHDHDEGRRRFAPGLGPADWLDHDADALEALMGRRAPVVGVRVARGLDTHFDDGEVHQGPRQQQGFDRVARLLDRLEASAHPGGDGSWLDHTTVVGFSELGRTPWRNEEGGRDHAAVTSCFLAGAGIRPGVVGASSPVDRWAEPVDLATGRVDALGEIPGPEHILRALRTTGAPLPAGHGLRGAPLSAILS